VVEPVLVSIAAALAAKAVTSVYDLVRAKFAGRPAATEVLEAADGAEPGSPEVAALSAELGEAERDDLEFAERLRTLWHTESVEQRAARGGVNNQISGNVSGKVVQARDIEGGITF
jgi:hypothetical protein